MHLMLSLVPFAVTASLNSHEGNKFFSGSPTLFWGTLLLTPIVLLPLYITLGKRKSGIKKARKAESFHYTLFFFFFFLKKKRLVAWFLSETTGLCRMTWRWSSFLKTCVGVLDNKLRNSVRIIRVRKTFCILWNSAKEVMNLANHKYALCKQLLDELFFKSL